MYIEIDLIHNIYNHLLKSRIKIIIMSSFPFLFFLFFFLYFLFVCLRKLYAQSGAQTHVPEIKQSCTLCLLSQPRAPLPFIS